MITIKVKNVFFFKLCYFVEKKTRLYGFTLGNSINFQYTQKMWEKTFFFCTATFVCVL